MNEVFSFDPDKFLQRAQPVDPQPLFNAPEAWTHGLALLRDRHLPRGASQQRWDQILADVTKLVTIWAPMAVSANWSMEDLFGFDPDGDYGLAVALRGQRLIDVSAE